MIQLQYIPLDQQIQICTSILAVTLSCFLDPANFFYFLVRNPTKIELLGIQLFDPDKDADIIRVKIDTLNGGLVTLVTSVIPKLDFTSFTYCYGQLAWQCNGNGYTENEIKIKSILNIFFTLQNSRYDGSSMSFVGLPSDIEEALNG